MRMESSPFGKMEDGRTVTAFTLVNDRGMKAVILDYGATLQRMLVPDCTGRMVDVVLGYNTLAEYETSDGYLGAIVGRVGNRIGRGSFTLGGKDHRLATNDRGNHLHGGHEGFDRKLWRGRQNGDELVLERISPVGEEGYPGTLFACVRYRLEEDGLRITYDLMSDADTLHNLTNHAYFNLSGGGTVLDHELQLFADRFLEIDEACLPTGKVLPVYGTPFDFRERKRIGQDIAAQDEQLRRGGGYDHNFCLSDPGPWKRAAYLRCPQTGIEMVCMTTQPGVQLYTANVLGERMGKSGRMGVRDAICLETQLWPDAVHHRDFPSAVLPAHETIHTQTFYKFSLS